MTLLEGKTVKDGIEEVKSTFVTVYLVCS